MKHKPAIFFSATIAVLCIFFGPASAQDIPGKKDSVNSSVLGQKRFIQVVLPVNYKPGSADKYDVIYVTDGDDNTKTVADIQQFITREGFMPQVIIVGVLNIDRNKDLTPTRDEGLNTSGGADKFLAFLKDELIPYVNKTYPSDGENILFGHSFGGLFVTYALFNEPDTFKSYIAADPSYWWGKGLMIRAAAAKLPTLANQEKTLFISGREGQGMKEMAINPMDTLLQKYAPKSLDWKVSAYPNETHGTVRLKSIYDGLRFVYEGYRVKAPEFHPMAGIMLKNKPITIWDFDDTTKVRFTTDGSMPTMASPTISRVITMQAPGTFTAKIFNRQEKYNKITAGVFNEGLGPAPVKKGRNFQPGGFHYAYYQGTWDKLPDFSQLKPVKEGITDKDFDLGKLPAKENFGLVISGQIEIKEEGYYVFAIASDDGSRLYFNNGLLLDDDGLHDNSDTKSYILPLKKGFYPVRLEYFQKDGGAGMKFLYLTPRLVDAKEPKPIAIPLELQYSGR
ncbi:alpha/beta hydrolase-fold protein [Mucilaginibacter sp.]|jgi:predicted alpha/beta superfamily hydrolase|uniref:alpha/beta hydrolase-fold protein n=1 Tax=Mucilaginibacter sp. TaxID=1882438 RepID=UPI002B845F1F|nr:alpha/beta hydrolase-fold protein [Mucilaginibacter sp.]HTI59112.1 alpha/beta hydrolase-fold protein [Mucilaginibacter sp.]